MQFRLFIRVLREPLESAPSFFSPILPGKHAINSSSESNSFCGDWFGRIDSTAWIQSKILGTWYKVIVGASLFFAYFLYLVINTFPPSIKSIDAKRAQKMATLPHLCIKVDEPSHDHDTIQMLLICMLYWIVFSTRVETQKRGKCKLLCFTLLLKFSFKQFHF